MIEVGCLCAKLSLTFPPLFCPHYGSLSSCTIVTQYWPALPPRILTIKRFLPTTKIIYWSLKDGYTPYFDTCALL